jgi:hypothetical protein
LPALSGAHGYEAEGCGGFDGAQCEAAALSLVDSCLLIAARVAIGVYSLGVGGFFDESMNLSRGSMVA